MKEVVIIGGGFAGINLAQGLAGKNGFHVTLVDKNNYNFFPPLLYQVSTGYLEASNISYPFRKLFQDKKNVSFRMGELQKVIPAENRLVLSTGEMKYDYLVFSTGAETNYFGMESVRKHSWPMKNVNDALELRNNFLQKLEQATVTTDPIERKKLLTIVIAGGGPTGVEIAGMLAEMKKFVFRKDYPELSNKGYESHIYLVDAVPQLLTPMSKQSQQDTYNALVKMGVEVKLNTAVKDYDNDVVTFANGETIETKTLVWAAGVSAIAFEGMPAESYGRGKRMIVDAYNRVQGFQDVFAIGDTCYQTTDAAFPNGHPQVAQVAIQQGKNLAHNLRRIEEGKEAKPFTYNDKGTMAIIGTNKAVADIGKMHFRGFIAWFLWVFVHLISLINYRNRVKTLYNWMGAYLTRDQSLRLLIRPSNEKERI